MAPNILKAAVWFSITFLGRDGLGRIRVKNPRAVIVRDSPGRPQDWRHRNLAKLVLYMSALRVYQDLAEFGTGFELAAETGETL
jgi:hypothetical protein